MKKIKFNCDEVVYKEKLDNGLTIYLYPTNKSKNYYVTVSTYFGAKVEKYKKDNKIYNVTPGSAHFLEHRVMDFTKNEEAAKKLSEYGSLVNAYTTYNGTNYNLFGQEKIIENMTLLFDRVFKAHIKEEDVESEKGIILEEYYMCQSDPYYILETKCISNAFTSSYIKMPVIGTVDGIKNASSKELNRLYKDFYTPENMFIVVSGNFDMDEVLSFIKKYTKNINGNSKATIIKPKEKDSVLTKYEEMDMHLNENKVSICYKIKRNNKIDKALFQLYLELMLMETFGKSSKAYKELKENGIERYSFFSDTVNEYNIVCLKASTNDTDLFIKIVEKYLNKIDIKEEALERKKRAFKRSYILSFEDITRVEDSITTELFDYRKIHNDIDYVINNVNMDLVKEYTDSLDFNNKSVLIMK